MLIPLLALLISPPVLGYPPAEKKEPTLAPPKTGSHAPEQRLRSEIKDAKSLWDEKRKATWEKLEKQFSAEELKIAKELVVKRRLVKKEDIKEAAKGDAGLSKKIEAAIRAYENEAGECILCGGVLSLVPIPSKQDPIRAFLEKYVYLPDLADDLDTKNKRREAAQIGTEKLRSESDYEVARYIATVILPQFAESQNDGNAFQEISRNIAQEERNMNQNTFDQDAAYQRMLIGIYWAGLTPRPGMMPSPRSSSIGGKLPSIRFQQGFQSGLPDQPGEVQ